MSVLCEIQCSNPACTTANAPRSSIDIFPCSNSACSGTYRMSPIGAARYRQWITTGEARRVEYEVVGLKIKAHAAVLYLRANHRLCTEMKCLHYNVAPMATGTHECTGNVDAVACPGFFSAGPQADEVYKAWATEYPSVFPQLLHSRSHSRIRSFRGRRSIDTTASVDLCGRKSIDSDKTLASTVNSEITLARVGSGRHHEPSYSKCRLRDNDFVLLPKIGQPGVPFPDAAVPVVNVKEDSASDKVSDKDTTNGLVSRFSPPSSPESAHVSTRSIGARTIDGGKSVVDKVQAVLRRPFQRSMSSSHLPIDRKSIAPSVASPNSKQKRGLRSSSISKPVVGVDLSNAFDDSFASAVRPPPFPAFHGSLMNHHSLVPSPSPLSTSIVPPLPAGVAVPTTLNGKARILPDPAALARRAVRPRAHSAHSSRASVYERDGPVPPVPPLPRFCATATVNAASGGLDLVPSVQKF
ncbi:hypothetical protein FISHEDRAFT_57810 [Fistulina hepatica ATCC 64428]|uniref:Uncharacterized protein n=1 Tax=Fistulina hepatica ATCC 64428 TaxID=1128425 RepID=A0A0D7AGE5_9AGAR|nr:hypothetical protein FISHEDRAFT_57810 [Fistulina hepatica ATCC 64428]